MKKRILIMTCALAFSSLIMQGCGESEYDKAYKKAEKEVQEKIDKQTADIQKEIDAQAEELQKEIDAQANEYTKSILEQEDPESDDATENASKKKSKENNSKIEKKVVKGGTYDVDGINVSYYTTVNNDVTGNWRLAVIYDTSDPNNYIADFYKKFVTDSSTEVFGIVNLGLRTTTRIDYMYDGWLDVSVMEYQDGEEHDANELYGGAELKHYWINSETGEIDETLD